MGNPIDEAAQARINERIQEFVTTFGVEFSKAYTQCVIDKVKADIEGDESLLDKLKLQDPPTPTQVLKTGMLVKVRSKKSTLTLFINYLSYSEVRV